MSESLSCDLCSDTGPLTLYAKCHPTAPLRVELLENGVIVLSCYIPDCNREVGRFKAEEFVEDSWKCPTCGARREEKMEINAQGSLEQPLCFEDNSLMIPLSWREACLESSKIAEANLKRANALQNAWPDGYAMPVEEDIECLTN